jgi:anti-sigma factor RsiW
MDCRLIQDELLPYVMATLSDEDRERTDAHLLACAGCLRMYLRLKRDVQRGASLGARPSDETRRRIRADVASLVQPRGAARVRQWLRRPIPLYQGLAVAAVTAGIAIGLPQALSALPRRAPDTTARVDMSCSVPQALAVY